MRVKTKQREAHRKRLLQADLDRDAEAPAFDQIKQFGFYASTITTLLSSGSAATLPGQAEITGKLTNAISQLQAAVREAEDHSQDSPMDGTGPTEAAPLGQAEAANPPPEVEVPAMPMSRAAGKAHASQPQCLSFLLRQSPA